MVRVRPEVEGREGLSVDAYARERVNEETLTNPLLLTATIAVIEVGPGARLTAHLLEQLDAVCWDEITPFGRIRPPGTDPAYTEVIGASARGWDRGALVRSVLPVPELARSLADGDPPADADAAGWREYILSVDPEDRPAVIAVCRDWSALPLILLADPGQRP